ncbi:MAG: PIN domain-containing protein [Candidatus Bathyarchaeia archaeon]
MPVGSLTALIMPFLCHFQSVLTEIPNFLATSEGRKSSSSIKELMELNKYLNLSTPKLLTTALNFIEWFDARTKILSLTPAMAFKAGEIKKKFRISLSDCYVIAAAMELKAKALFLKPEKEMLNKIEELRNFPIEFLAEINLK